jgi:type II secretory pathway pseudopilin PulG
MMIGPSTPIDRRGKGESGFALITVLLALTALLALSATAVAYGVGSQNLSRRDQNWNASLAAAEAGIDDFVFRLNENSNYFQYSASNQPPDGNKAFVQYVPVPGGNTISTFRYSTDTSKIAVDGTILMTSTGKVGNTKRTVQATLRRRTFIDYLYYTDYETLDPALYTGPLFTGDTTYTPAQATTNCTTYAYATPGRGSGCTEINFISADNVNGPLHSNDSFLVCGAPHFNGNTSTAWNKAAQPRYRVNSSCTGNNPVFANPGDPKYLPTLAMPPSNSSIKTETAAGKGGCLFTGPTSITLNSNGTMTTTSPFSKQVNGSCTKNGTGPLPTNGVIYVQSVPSASSDPNFTSGCPYTNPAHPLPALIVTNDANQYACRDGDVFVQGQLKGQLTIASANNVVITGNITYNGGTSGTSLLGLVANNFVQVRHPVQLQTTTYNPVQTNQPAACASSFDRTDYVTNSAGKYVQRICSDNLTGAQSSPTINAAILAVNHSFTVPYWQRGAALGTLNVTGAIAQRFRGPVGTNSSGTVITGYGKNYVYDQRLKYLSPPKFLDPVASAWGVAVWREIKVPAGL